MICEIRDLKKSYGEKEVLKGISLKIEKGDVLSVLGPSGSGKTTLLRCMNFLERADSGILNFDDTSYDLSNIKGKEISAIRKKTSFVFQNYNLFLNKTAIQNITLGLTVRGMDKKEALDRGMELLGKVGLSEYASYFPLRLSGGQQQRVAIARALANDPEIIYFDEPTSALDPELINEVLLVIRDLAIEKRTMIIVTHEMNFAKNVSNKTIFMENGTIVEMGDTKEIFDSPKEERTKRFLKGQL